MIWRIFAIIQEKCLSTIVVFGYDSPELILLEEISCTHDGSSWFLNTHESGCSDVPASVCKLKLGLWRFLFHWVYTTHKVFINIRLTCIYWFRGYLLDFLCCLEEARSWLEAVLLPLFSGTGSWVVFIGTSTLSGAFLAGLKDFVTPLRPVNESSRLFAMCCKYMNLGRRAQILEYVDMKWDVESLLISWHYIGTWNLPLMPGNNPSFISN
jgi:hypothetical protein